MAQQPIVVEGLEFDPAVTVVSIDKVLSDIFSQLLDCRGYLCPSFTVKYWQGSLNPLSTLLTCSRPFSEYTDRKLRHTRDRSKYIVEMPSRKGETGRHSPLEPRQEEGTSRHRSRRHDKERERSRSPQDRLTSKTSQDYERDGKDETGKERHRRERERTDRRQREEGQREERQRREGEKGDRRRKLEGEREDQTHREKGEARQEKRERDREWRDRQREERGKREWRQREEGERSDGRQREERRGEGTRGEKEVGRQRSRHREGEERQEVEVEHNTESSADQTTKRDEERKRKRELRMAEDEEAKNYEFGGSQDQSKNKEDTQKEEPNFELSGKLTAETNTYKGVVIKYSEPAEARQPTTRWRLYQFKGEEVLPTLYVHRQSAYLIGRDRRVVDLPVDHPSCSSQHAVLQYRLVNYEKKDGSTGKRVRPYLIDLESTNGTYINNQRIESARYWELKEKDMIKFGFSSREYILLHENSQDVDAVS